MTRQKQDTINKFNSKLKNYKLIAVQDEQLAKWHSDRKFSRKVQHDIMGGIISGIKQMPQTVIIDKYEPTTKKCYICGRVTNITLKDRIFKCQCGFEMDRDTKSAIYVLLKAKQISSGRRNFMPVEDLSSFSGCSATADKTFSLKQEATICQSNLTGKLEATCFS